MVEDADLGQNWYGANQYLEKGGLISVLQQGSLELTLKRKSCEDEAADVVCIRWDRLVAPVPTLLCLFRSDISGTTRHLISSAAAPGPGRFRGQQVAVSP